MTASLEKIIGRLLAGKRVSLPGPGHSKGDDSLSVRPAKNADGFTVKSFAGDDRQACIEHVKALLDPEKRAALVAVGAAAPARDDPADARRAEDPFAKGWYGRWLARKAEGGPRVLVEGRPRHIDIWDAAVSPIRTIVEPYLWIERHLELDPDIAGSVVRFHPECPWKDELTEQVLRVPCMVAAMRSIETDEIVAIQRTRLSPVGQKIDRRMLGPAAGAAIKLDADVTCGLVIGEGIETCMTARQLGLRPVWALGSSEPIKSLPVLAGVESLTILAEICPASAEAIEACGRRWHAAGREVLINRPIRGKDLNDAIRGAT
jgi:putative DNA primase/helicase